MTFPSRPVLFKWKCVPIPFNRKTGMEQEAEQVTIEINGVTDNTPDESKKAKRGTISVDLLLVVHIWRQFESINDPRSIDQ